MKLKKFQRKRKGQLKTQNSNFKFQFKFQISNFKFGHQFTEWTFSLKSDYETNDTPMSNRVPDFAQI